MSTTKEMLSYMELKPRILWITGAFCSALTGLALPSFAVVFGEVVKTFDPTNATTLDDLMVALLKQIMIIAGIIWIIAYFNYALLQ